MDTPDSDKYFHINIREKIFVFDPCLNEVCSCIQEYSWWLINIDSANGLPPIRQATSHYPVMIITPEYTRHNAG